MSRSAKSSELSQLLILVFSVVAIAVLYLAKTVVVPLALAILFSFLLSPLVTLLERIRLPRVMAILVVILAAAAVVGTMGWTGFNQLVSVTDHMADFTYNISRKLETLKPANIHVSQSQEKSARFLGALPRARSSLMNTVDCACVPLGLWFLLGAEPSIHLLPQAP